jgi:hypothetical protein
MYPIFLININETKKTGRNKMEIIPIETKEKLVEYLYPFFMSASISALGKKSDGAKMSEDVLYFLTASIISQIDFILKTKCNINLAREIELPLLAEEISESFLLFHRTTEEENTLINDESAIKTAVLIVKKIEWSVNKNIANKN